jgi:uroporphyrinogen-III decarboxylase
MKSLTSRERMIRAISYQEVDHIPCAFMSFTAMRNRVNDNFYKLCEAELKMGLDSMLFLPYLSRRERPDHPELRGLPIHFPSDVQTKEWREETNEGKDILHKEYITPVGTLSTSVQLSGDWPHGNHIPFVDDYQVPRAIKPLITEPEELEVLQYLLQPPNEEDRVFYSNEKEKANTFVQANNVLLVGGWGVGMDMANWLCGMGKLLRLAISKPNFVENLFEMIHKWNYERMKLVLEGNIDLYIRRSWYEGCDFVLPKFYERVILPRLKKEIDLVHEHGARFGYICSSGLDPMLKYYKQAGFDVLIGLDPIQGTYTNMPKIKEEYAEQIAIWGGVSGAITVEMGSEDEIRSAVRQAVEILGPKGFILSPVDNITVDEAKTWENLYIFIDEWKKHW